VTSFRGKNVIDLGDSLIHVPRPQTLAVSSGVSPSEERAWRIGRFDLQVSVQIDTWL